jgi:hypothetical protein
MRLAPVLALTGMLALFPATSAHGYLISGDAWPRATISYYPGAYAKSVKRAARAWNKRRAGVRFRRASKESADLVVSYGGPRCSGESLIGYEHLMRSWVMLGRGCSKGVATVLAAHELGHVLGLDHEDRHCALMNPILDADDGTPSQCRHRALGFWLKRTVQRDDLRGALALYR